MLKVNKIFMSKMKRFSLLMAGILVFFEVVTYAQKPAEHLRTEVIILHVNDMHAKIDDLPKLAYLADSLRSLYPFVFLVAAGDNFTGNPVVDMIPDKGYPMIDLMNSCGFKVSCLGNHEFDLGQDFLNKRIAQAEFPFICCNLDASEAEFRQPRDYYVLYAGSEITLAILGLIQIDANGLPSSHPSKMKNIKFSNGLEKAKEYKWLKERYHILIGLSHLGVEDDIRLADSMPQFDLIIGGHSHTILDPPLVKNGVMIVQTGSNLKYVGKTTLQIEEGKLVNRREEIIPIASLTQSRKGMDTLINKYNRNEIFSSIIGYAASPLEGEDELGSLMTDALTEGLKVDFAFQNKGGIRVQHLPQGDITLKDIYKLDPFNNQVVIFNMSPAEIQSLICYGYKQEKGIDLQVSGMTYTLTADSQYQCITVDIRDAKGNPLDFTRDYTVAMNSYLADTYTFDHRDPGITSTLTTAEALIQYLKEKKTIRYQGVKRAHLVK